MGMTRQRKIILTVLSDSVGGHLTVDQIFEKVRKEIPNIGMGTVYRNLNLLADEGKIKRLQIIGHPIRFDDNPEAHEHIVCVTCGRILDIGDIEPSILRKLAGSQTEIVDHSLIVYDVCDNCSMPALQA